MIKLSVPETRQFQQTLLDWQSQHGRHDLPWQQDNSLYTTWISEIMLQQTQVQTVIPYYQRFIKDFPTITTLAKAPLDEVLALWSGLGYYARARNLHKAAQWMLAENNGQFPTDFEVVLNLAGIGRSTAGAILSLSDGQFYPILDGNVRRVYCRYFMVKGHFSQSQTQKTLWQLAQDLLSKEAGQYNQALMDLGSQICTHRQMQCGCCPINKGCSAYKKDEQSLFPEKRQKKKRPTKEVFMLLLVDKNNHVLLEQRPNVGIWGGLWSLPEISNDQEMMDYLNKKASRYIFIKQLKGISHVFSHFRLNISPHLYRITKKRNTIREAGEIWYDLEYPAKIGLPKPVATIFNEIKGELNDGKNGKLRQTKKRS